MTELETLRKDSHMGVVLPRSLHKALKQHVKALNEAQPPGSKYISQGDIVRQLLADYLRGVYAKDNI